MTATEKDSLVSAPSATTSTTTTTTATTFRTAKRTSNVRSIIFAIESLAVLTVYLVAIWLWNDNNDNNDEDRDFFSIQLSQPQQIILSLFGMIYMIRLNIMSSWFLPRELAMEELTFVILIWIPSILSSFVLAANPTTSISILVISIILYVVGSFLNTYSELQRKWWKESSPSHKGRAYTGGLFSLSRNINYFGDTMLFAGWAVATASWVNVWVPLLMGCSFWFYHIPDKESYLQERYAADWPAYTKQTPNKFIPYVC